MEINGIPYCALGLRTRLLTTNKDPKLARGLIILPDSLSVLIPFIKNLHHG